MILRPTRFGLLRATRKPSIPKFIAILISLLICRSLRASGALATQPRTQRLHGIGAFGGLLLVALLILVSPLCLRAQSIQYTQNKPDQSLRSAMRVDPTTLGLSIEVPLGGY